MNEREINLSLVRKMLPEKIAEDLVSVQPMSNIDFLKLGESWLWKSFVLRHFKDS